MSDKHKFVAELIWQTRFARKYKCRYINRAFREYRNDDEYSLSRSKKTYQHYLDFFLNKKIILDEQIDLIEKYKGIRSIIKSTLIINILRDYLDISFFELLKNTINVKIKVLYLFSYIPSLVGKYIIKYIANHNNK